MRACSIEHEGLPEVKTAANIAMQLAYGNKVCQDFQYLRARPINWKPEKVTDPVHLFSQRRDGLTCLSAMQVTCQSWVWKVYHSQQL